MAVEKHARITALTVILPETSAKEGLVRAAGSFESCRQGSLQQMNEKQFDPRMHSAEHIINQTMIRMFGCKRCFSAHIEKKKSKVDYRFDRDLLEQEVEQLQNRVNEIIAADLPVSEEAMSRHEAETVFNLHRLPETAGDQIRIIRIGDYDACPCIGPHVKSTKELGRFRVISTSFDNGVLRIRFKLEA